MKTLKTMGLASVAGLLAVGSVAAEETKISGSMMDVANVPGQAVGAGKYVGFAVFEDGRIAFKNFVAMTDSAGEKGSYGGYSTYTFQNGDAITLKFIGGWTPESDGGDYEVLSGTGAFKGASGTGRFEAAKNPWKDANLYKCSITLKLPSS